MNAPVEIKPTGRAHALLSASSAYRWTVCTKAPHFEDQFPDSSSWAAQEGTIAHAVAEFCLLNDVNDLSEVSITPYEVRELQELIAHYEKEGLSAEDIDHEMASMFRYVQEYISYVFAIPGVRYIEQRVDFSHLVPEGFGTSDAIILNGDVVDVVDLKYGKGKKVYANGPQAKLYALGAINDLGFIFDNVKTVRIHIHQPRLDWVDVYECTIEELNEYGQWLKGQAEKAYKNEGEYVAGDHCDFCRARKVCKARADANLRVAQEEFGEPCPSAERLTLEDIAGLLPRLKQISKWCSDVEEYAMEQALKGTEVPGYKLVEGRTTRKWSDEAAVAEAMRATGLTDDQIYNMKLIGFTEAEKLLGRKSPVFDLATKTTGKPALVPVNDKRPAMTTRDSAFMDFAEPEDE